MITSLLLIRSVMFSLMSAQLSVEKEVNRTLYTASGVSGGQYAFNAIY
jgi:hypothetical protein